jgi:aldehyde dehydrogenase (NAD+)
MNHQQPSYGEQRPAQGGGVYDNFSPKTKEKIGVAADASLADAEAALVPAR